MDKKINIPPPPPPTHLEIFKHAPVYNELLMY